MQRLPKFPRNMKDHEPDHPLTDHEGILRVETDPQHATVDVEFDPSKLSDSEVRSLLKEHISQVESTIRKSTFRLEGNACEACAQKLEKKVGRIPGVRRATATYLGRVLSVTFDSASNRRIASPTISGRPVPRYPAAGAARHGPSHPVAEDTRRRTQRGDFLRSGPAVSRSPPLIVENPHPASARWRTHALYAGAYSSPASRACARPSPRCARRCWMWMY